MTSRLLITGTDTGIGKTTVGSVIAAAFRRRAIDVGVIKPVETGCATGPDGQLVPADALQLRWFAGRSDPIDVVCPVRLPEPLAPTVAARRAGVVLETARLVAAIEAHGATCALQLVEGAGGLLVPVAGADSFADLAAACDLAVLVVVGNRLGCVNHAALTVRCARAAGLRIAGYVVNSLRPDPDLAMQTNAALLAELIGPSIGELPWLGALICNDAERQRLAELGERHLALDALLG
ncbi:MAG: dethiobiotin synthase [Deltaproteobacteria bacterium]|nr:dethiobiotin synthase [Deltaproteobacteria bacterium]